MLSPSAIACDTSFNSTAPTPLPNTVPVASASNARQWPSSDQMPPFTPICPATCGTRTDAAPTSAMPLSPERIDWQARCIATSEVEHAVCTLMLGPVRFSL